MTRGRFIVFEGGDACGKSTQARRLAGEIGALFTFEPGATPSGARMRAIVLDPATGDLDPRAEVLLYAADKAQHVHEIIEPALAAGRDVVCDRYVSSAIAYQGYGRGLDLDMVTGVLSYATRGLVPDLTILLEVSSATARARLGNALDRLEAEALPFHERVAEGFRELAGNDPARWIVVDGEGTVDEVGARIGWLLRERLAR